MRAYPHNSPHAAARIVALLLICDGHVSRSETQALYGLEIERELGLPEGDFAKVLHTLCEDLLLDTQEQKLFSVSMDQATLGALLSEITDSELQCKVLYFAHVAAMADQHVAHAEAWVMREALKRWPVVVDAMRSASPGQTKPQLEASLGQ